MKRLLLVAFSAISLSACAQAPDGQAPAAAQDGVPAAAVAASPNEPTPAAGTPEARALEAIRGLNPSIPVERIAESPMPGFREAIVGGQVVYVSDDGRYLFLPGSGGALYDAQDKRNLTESALAGMRRDLLAKIPQSERIVFAPPNPVHTVTVFTDVECGYCR